MKAPNATGTTEKKICVIGTKSAGKSLALEQIETALYQKRFGYTSDWSFYVKEKSDSFKKIADHRELHGEAPTVKAEQHYYDISMHGPFEGQSAPQKRDFRINILDVPGEIFTDPASHREAREGYDAWQADCDGAVAMFSVPHLLMERQAKYLIDEIQKLAQQRSENPDKGPQRIAIAITMSELLTVPFGPFAAEVGSDPGKMKRLLVVALKALKNNFLNALDGIQMFAEQGRIDIRFIPISTFGYFPAVGSANISSDIKDLVLEGRPRSQPYQTNRYYPFLVADPFIFAATGESNDFFFKIEDLAI